MDYLARARELVVEYIMPKMEKTDEIPAFGVYVVWFSKTLQNWKALVSTTLPDGMYYEVTYNGDKREAYIDVYKKFDNVCVPDVPGEEESVEEYHRRIVDAYLPAERQSL